MLRNNQSGIKAQADADAGKPAASGGVRAGGRIAGNLFRGSGGQFQAGPGAQLQQRLAEIRAKRLGKGKGKAKAKGKTKGKAAKPSRAQQAAANRTAALAGMRNAPNAASLEALDALAGGKSPDADMAQALADETGLVEKAKDGSFRLSSHGRALLGALSRGDAGGAGDALSKGADALATRDEREQAKSDRVAARQKKQADKAKAKGGAKPKAKQAAAPKEQAPPADVAKNRAAVADKVGITGAGADALSKLAGGDGMDEATAKEQEKIGLVERDSEGKPRASAQGRALLRAMDSGDAGAAVEAVSRAKDAVAARGAKEKAKATSDQAKAGRDQARATRTQERAKAKAATDKAKADKEKAKASTTAASRRQTIDKAVGAEVARIASARATKATAPPSTGVMVALFLPSDAALRLAARSAVTEAPADMHITLAYLGQTDDMQLARRKAKLIAVLSGWVAQQAPLAGVVNGLGRFFSAEADDTNAVYAAPDVPGLPELRQSLVTSLARAGLYAADNHGFTPHITIAYVPKDDPTPPLRLPTIPLAFDAVALAWGAERVLYPLGMATKKEDIMADFAPILTDLETLTAELAEIKAGARHSASDMQSLQEIAEAASTILDLAVDLGASEPDDAEDAASGETDNAETTDDALAELKAMIGGDPLAYAQHECGDIAGACSALQSLAMLMQSELSEGAEDDEGGTIAKLCDGMRTLTDFIRSEIDAIEGAGGTKAIGEQVIALLQGATLKDLEAVEAFMGETLATGLGNIADALRPDGAKAIAKREDVNPKAGIAVYGKDDAGYAVKMLGDDEVFGPAIWLNGSPDTHDLSAQRDYFTKSTDFWLDHWDRRPMLWHHAQDEADILVEMRRGGASEDEVKAIREAFAHLRDNPVIGVWTKATADPIAVWLHGQLNKAHRYRSAIKELVARGLIKISTDSAPHLVVREARANGTHEVKRWPIVAGSLTVSAAEPRLYDVQAVKAWYEEAGIPMPGEMEETKDDRARAMLLELDLIEIEEGIPA